MNNPQEWQNLTFKMCLMLIIYERSTGTIPYFTWNYLATGTERRRQS